MTMQFAPSELSFWNKVVPEAVETTDDRAINERYTRGEGRIVIEINREKLPGFIAQLKNPEFMDLRPFYQRRPRWTQEQQSLLIESFIMNIPVPPVFLYEKNFNSFEVMDGQQRITAIRDFYNNSFKLKGLQMWPEINGRTYTTLPEMIKAGIDRRSITSIVMLKESTGSEEEESLLRETVFERLNTGGVELGRQEIRNALYKSDFNNLLDELTHMDEFREVWGLPRWTKNEIETNPGLLSNTFFSKMGDNEIILRFFALRHAAYFKWGMQGFLDLYMRKAVQFNQNDIELLRALFVNTFKLAIDIYGDKVFKPYNPETKEWEKKPHRAFYDAVMVALAEQLAQSEKLKTKATEVVEETKNLFINNENGTFTGRANTKQDVLNRIDLYRKMLIKILG